MSHTIGQVQEDNQSSISSQEAARLSTLEDKTSKSVLSDADYEFLYNQLLEGISHGWHERRITKFFKQLGDRGKQEDWVAWLERLQGKIPMLPIQSKRQLGMLMIRLGELTQSSPQAREIGAVSNRIGRELLFGNTQDVIWEYVGSDIIPDSPTAEIETKEDLSQRLPTDFTELGTSAKATQTDLAREADEKESPQHEMTEKQTYSDAIAPESENRSEITVESEYKLGSRDREILQIIDNDLQGDGDTSEPQTDLLLNNSEEYQIDTVENPDSIEIDKDPVAIDMDRVMNLIQQDPNLAREISEKLNIVPELQPDLAKEISDNSSDIVSPQSNTSIELIEGWFNLGLKQASAKEFKGAIVSWEKALKINPNLSEAWHNRGSALGRLGKYREAVSSFQKALTIDPHNYQAWNDRAHALYQLQEWSEAAESWHNALEIMPGNYLFWYNRGCALEQLGDWSKAIASYEKSLEINPDFQSARSRYTNLVADNSRSN